MIVRSKSVLTEKSKETSLPVKYNDRSFNPRFTEKFFTPPCPACSGVEFKDIEAQGNLKGKLCSKCRAKLNIRIAGREIHAGGGANSRAFEKAA